MYIESVTGDIVAKALDVSAFNHKVIANNVANAGVKGYSAGRVNFDSVMQELRALVERSADSASFNDALNRIDEKNMVYFSSVENRVSIDHEMLQLTENTLRYQALLRARSELGEILKSAISGGGRG